MKNDLIVKFLEFGYDLTPEIKKLQNKETVDILNLFQLKENVPLIFLHIDEKYPLSMLPTCLHYAMEGINVYPFLDTKKNYDEFQIDEIATGIIQRVDVSKYSSHLYNFRQMYNIRLGLTQGLDVSYYAHPKFSEKQMERIYWGLLKKVDVSKYASLEYTWQQMTAIFIALDRKVYVPYYANPKLYNGEQMLQLFKGLINKVDVLKYDDPAYNAQQMAVIRNGLELGLDVSKYSDINLSAEKMTQTYKDLLTKIPVK